MESDEEDDAEKEIEDQPQASNQTDSMQVHVFSDQASNAEMIARAMLKK